MSGSQSLYLESQKENRKRLQQQQQQQKGIWGKGKEWEVTA